MAELVALLHLHPDADPAALADTLSPEALVAPVLPGGRNAGDLLVRMRHATTAPDFGPAVARFDGALFEIAAGAGDVLASPIHRTALFHAFRRPHADRLARFEQETVAMPRRLPFIRGWALGRVTRSWGRFPWDYVWEQGYDRLGDLTGRYMRHPCHWGQVDRWFDPEHPDWLIDPGLCHAFCRQAPDMEDAA